MMSENSDFGRRGEEIAADFLKKKGYSILELNWRSGKNEVDIIAKDGKYLVIVEVKSRTSTFAGEPEMAVTRKSSRYIPVLFHFLLRAYSCFILPTSIVL